MIRIPKKRRRSIYFVASGIKNDQILMEEILSKNIIRASQKFKKKFDIEPFKILRPFYKKKIKEKISDKNVVFSNIWKKIEYHGWICNACILKFPENTYWIMPQEQIDKNLNKPIENIISIFEAKEI